MVFRDTVSMRIDICSTPDQLLISQMQKTLPQFRPAIDVVRIQNDVILKTCRLEMGGFVHIIVTHCKEIDSFF